MRNPINPEILTRPHIPMSRPPLDDEIEVRPNQNLYHELSIRSGEWAVGEAITKDYDRTASKYDEEINRASELDGARVFDLEQWRGKTILDLGAGGMDRFGQEARDMGIRVISLNPALKLPEERQRLQPTAPEATSPERLAALGQALPVAEASVDCVVSVYAVPYYLHHVDTKLYDDAAILDDYTPYVREQDKALMAQAFQEIVRVLRPGGKAYLKDAFRGAKQTKYLNPFSPSDGTEAIEALDLLDGATTQVYERENVIQLGLQHIPASTERTIVITKNVPTAQDQLTAASAN